MQIQNIQLCNIFYFSFNKDCTNVYLFDFKFIYLFILYKFLFILLKNFLYDIYK